MQRIKKLSATLVVASFIAVCVSVVSPAPAQTAGSAPVTVLNTAAQPVPVALQGTGSVAGTVNALQSGNWTVGVASLPAVQLASGATVALSNSPAVPIHTNDTEGSVKNAFAVHVCAGDAGRCTDSDIATLPAGQRFVIEQISGVCIGPPPGGSEASSFFLSLPLNGQSYDYFLKSQPQGRIPNVGDTRIVISDQTRVYADGSVAITRLNVLTTQKCEATVAGHLVAM